LLGRRFQYTATVETIVKNELICSIVAKVKDRIIATGKTGQKMFKTGEAVKIVLDRTIESC